MNKTRLSAETINIIDEFLDKLGRTNRFTITIKVKLRPYGSLIKFQMKKWAENKSLFKTVFRVKEEHDLGLLRIFLTSLEHICIAL